MRRDTAQEAFILSMEERLFRKHISHYFHVGFKSLVHSQDRCSKIVPPIYPIMTTIVLIFNILTAFDMLITTTNNIEGKKITQYIGLVNGEAIIGANFVKDFFAGISDIVGGRSGAYEQGLREAKSIALKEMIEQAQRLGANAIIGVDLDYQTIGGSGTMLMVSANGTAIIYE